MTSNRDGWKRHNLFETAKSALPDTDSSVRVGGITDTVSIFRDKWGIPYIKAESERDLFFGQGFATAQDRLFQMDYDRQRCLGRWSEFAGKGALPADILMRRRNLGKTAIGDYNVSSENAKTMMNAYAAGVNAFIRTTHVLPVEYSLLKTEPEPWEAWHCAAVYKTRNTAEGNFGAKTWLARLAAEVGAQQASAIFPGYLPGHLVTIPPNEIFRGERLNAVEELARSARMAGLSNPPDGESNAWAISGEFTTTGMPLVAGDSHRTLDTPNVYMQIRLFCPSLSVLGYTIPGWPGVIHFCHNERVAWGMTHGMAETQDLFIERFRKASTGKMEYLFKGGWLPVEQKSEIISARGASDIEISIAKTHHGPILSDDIKSGEGLALSDPGSTPTPWIDGAYSAMKASNANQFERAMDLWTDRTNNYLYADRDGSFGYKFGGLVPLRSSAHRFGPAPGWTGDHEWLGYIPRSELPRSRNPKQGWVVSCNQKIADVTYPHFLSNWWAPDYRAKRISSRILEGAGSLSSEKMAEIHADAVSIPAERMKASLSKYHSHIANGTSAKVIKAILNWDAKMDKNSSGAAAYAALHWEMIAKAARSTMGELAEEALSGKDAAGASHIWRFIMPLLCEQMTDGEVSLFGNRPVHELFSESAHKAYEVLRDRLGESPDEWRWGDVHLSRHTHPLAATFPDAADLLNPPSIGTHGDGATPLAGSHMGDFRNMAASVNRYVHDPADWNSGSWIVPLGASGHPASPHYTDQQSLWANVESIPQIWDWKSIKAEAKSIQRLEPIS